jgi:hypothetical protein
MAILSWLTEGKPQGINVDQTKDCPFCEKEIKAEAVLCPFCGSDLSVLAFKNQKDSQLKKKGGPRGLKVLGYLIAASLLVYLRRFLPEDARHWYDWLFGVGTPGLLSPARIFVLLCIAVIGCLLLRYRR